MRIRVFLLLAAILFVGPAFAQKIYINYDKDYDRSTIKTYAWMETAQTSVRDSDPLLHSRIVNGIEHYITLGGLTETDGDPDVYITYHGSSKQELSVNTSSIGVGYGYPSGWGYGPYGGYGGYYGHYYGTVYSGMATTTVTYYQVGTLVIDVWDADTQKLIWRGTAANVTLTDNPKKMAKKLDKALRKMVDKWRRVKEAEK